MPTLSTSFHSCQMAEKVFKRNKGAGGSDTSESLRFCVWGLGGRHRSTDRIPKPALVCAGVRARGAKAKFHGELDQRQHIASSNRPQIGIRQLRRPLQSLSGFSKGQTQLWASCPEGDRKGQAEVTGWPRAWERVSWQKVQGAISSTVGPRNQKWRLAEKEALKWI